MDSWDIHTDTTAPVADLVVTRAFDAFGALVLASGPRAAAAPEPAPRPWGADRAPAPSSFSRS